MRDVIWYFPFSVWLTSLSVTITGSTHVAANGTISFFLLLSHVPFIYVPHLHPFLCWWTFRLIPCLDYCKQCCVFALGLLVMSDSSRPHGLQPGSSVHGDSRGKNTGVGGHSLLQRICLTQGSNPGLLHCRQILYHMSYREVPMSSMFSGRCWW